jgi:hypothetical protein
MMEKGRHWAQRLLTCPYGHRYTPENTYRRGPWSARVCRTCTRVQYQQWRLTGSKVGWQTLLIDASPQLLVDLPAPKRHLQVVIQRI